MSDISITDRVSDAINLVELRAVPRFVGFLSSSQCAECSPLLKNIKHAFFGGYQGAERTILGVFPDWCEMDESEFPITPLTFNFNTSYTLSHRDFLGTVMSLGIKREAVGDILIDKGKAVVFLTREIAPYVKSQISKVGGVGVTITEGVKGKLPQASEVASFTASVSSLRADCVVAALGGKSRSGAIELIEKGLVSVNSVGVVKPTQTIGTDDIVSVRGGGRFKITEAEHLTKKGRIILKWNKYI